MKLFAGTSSQKLGKSVAEKLAIPLSDSQITIFGNSEIKIRIKEDVKNTNCVVIQSTSRPTNDTLMEMAFYCDALKRQEAKRIIGVIPFFGYAKQNIQHLPGECVSVNVVIRLFESLGFFKIYTFDLHDEATAGVFSIPFKNISALPFMATKIKKMLEDKGIKQEDIVLVSPDQGAVEKVRNFGKAFYGTDDFHEVVIEKSRDKYVADTAHPVDLYGDVKGKIALIVDDMVVSGGTLIPAANLCLEKGAKEVYGAAVHPDFTVDAPQKLQDSALKAFFTTDSIQLAENQYFPKLIQISLTDIIAEELKDIK